MGLVLGPVVVYDARVQQGVAADHKSLSQPRFFLLLLALISGELLPPAVVGGPR